MTKAINLLALAMIAIVAIVTPARAADSLPSAMLGTWCTQEDDDRGTPMTRCAPGSPNVIRMTPHAMDSEGDHCRVVSIKTLEAARWLVSHVCDSQPSRTYGWTFFRDGETLYLTPTGTFTERDWTRRGRPATYTCAGFKVSPPERKDDDPVVSTEIEVGFEMDGKRPRLDVTHTTLKGEVYKRAEQYRDIRFWSTTYSDNWSGVSVKNPRRTMVGRMTYDRDEHHPRGYIEQSFVNGRLERTTTSVCTLAAGGSRWEVADHIPEGFVATSRVTCGKIGGILWTAPGAPSFVTFTTDHREELNVTIEKGEIYYKGKLCEVE